VFVQEHIKQAENIQRMVVPHMLWCESYLQSEVVWIPRVVHGRKWNKLCNILIKGKKCACYLLGCDGCCMWKRSRPDEKGKRVLMMDCDKGGI